MKRLAAVSLTVVVAGTGFWLSHHRGGPAVTRPNAIHQSADNLTEISTLADDRAARAASLHAEGKGIRGEGIDMPEPGTLAFTSFNGAHVTQRVAAAAIIDRDGQTRALARQPSDGVASGDGQKSQARFADFFAGLDLEYTWDGRDIEEFFHLDDGLRQDVVRSGGSLVLTTVFPGLDPKNAALVKKFRDAKYNPEGYTLFSYAAVKAWADAANKAKSTEAAKVAAALRSGKFDSAVGVLEFDAKGDIKGN
jgi:hypothetical protein